MAINSQEIDLIIKAQLQGKNTLGDLVKSIELVEKALEKQSQAAKRGEGDIQSLQATLVELKIAQDRLKDQAQLIGQFQRLNDQIEKQQTRIEATKKAYDELDEKILKAGKSTEKQAERLQKLTDATAKQEVALDRQKVQYTQLSSVLTESGIDLNNLSKAENVARESAAKLGLAINKTQESIRTFNADVKKANDEKLFQNQLQDSAKLVKSQTYIDFFTDALNKADVAKKKLATGNELKQIADDAVVAAKGFTTLNNAIQPKSNLSLKDTIQSVIDPARNANKSLSDLERNADKLTKTTQGLSGPVKEYNATLKELRAIQNNLVNTSSKVDNFSGAVASLRQARSEFSAARGEVLKYAESVRNSSERNAELEANLAKAQARLRAASGSLNEQVTRTRALREELRQAGVNTSNLVQSQQRLTSVARSTADSINRLNTSVKLNGEATVKAAGSLNLFSNSGRTTLSITQRFRGEILALTSSYIGFFGVYQQGSSILAAYNKNLAIQSQLSLSVGNDTRKIADEYNYASDQADRLGISFDKFATGYAKFLASGTTAGQDRGTLRFIFESFSEVGKVAKLTEDQLDGVFEAIGQILSKGKIQAEELRGQLGDRIFGAFGVAANALKAEFPNFDEALKKGLVGAEYLNDIARVYKDIVAPRLGIAVDDLTSKQSKLTTAIFKFKVAIAEGGFADQFILVLERLTNFLKSEDGTKFGKALIKIFVALGEVAVFLIDHIDGVVLALKVFAGLKILITFGGLLVKFKKATLLTGEFIDKLGGLIGIVRILIFTIGGLFLAFVGIKLFKFLYDQFPAFKSFVDDTVEQFDRLINKALEYLGLRDQASEGKFAKSDSLKGEEKRLARLKEITQEIIDLEKSRDNPGTRSFTPNADARFQANRKIRLDRQIKKLKDEEAELKALEKKAVVASPFVPAKPGKTGPTEGDLERTRKKYESLLAEVDSQLNTLEGKVTKKTADTLQEKLDAIKADYENLENKINKLGGKDRTQALGRLNNVRDALVIDANDENDKKILDKRTQLEDSLAQIEAQAAQKEKLSLESRLKVIDEAQAEEFRKIEDFRKQLVDAKKPTAPADDLKAKRTVAVDELKQDDTRKFFLDEVEHREKAINELLSQRASRIQTLNEFQKAGLLSEFATLQKSGEVVNELQPQIEELTNKALAFAEANRLAFTPEFIEKFIAATTQAKFSANELRTELFTAKQLGEQIADGATKAIDEVTKSIGEAAVGTGTWADAITTLRNSFVNFAADFLRQIALMIIKAQILKGLQEAGVNENSGGILGTAAKVLNKAAGGSPGDSPINPIYTEEAKILGGGAFTDAIQDPTKGILDNFFETVKDGFNGLVNIGKNVFNAIGGFLTKLFSSSGGGSGGDASGGFIATAVKFISGLFHDGGIIGASGGRSRAISPLEFVGAPRYHSGGIPGLAPDEYASILQKNEEVLSADNPRNILNGGAGTALGATTAPSPQNIKILNMIDSASVISEGLSTQEGTKAIVNVIRANRSSIKSALGV